MTSAGDLARRTAAALTPLGPVRARAMFGGFGLYFDGRMFAIVGEDGLFFKVDDATRERFLDAGAKPFTYWRGGRRVEMSYYQVPIDDRPSGGALLAWAELAVAAAGRAPERRRRRPTP